MFDVSLKWLLSRVEINTSMSISEVHILVTAILKDKVFSCVQY